MHGYSTLSLVDLYRIWKFIGKSLNIGSMKGLFVKFNRNYTWNSVFKVSYLNEQKYYTLFITFLFLSSRQTRPFHLFRHHKSISIGWRTAKPRVWRWKVSSDNDGRYVCELENNAAPEAEVQASSLLRGWYTTLLRLATLQHVAILGSVRPGNHQCPADVPAPVACFNTEQTRPGRFRSGSSLLLFIMLFSFINQRLPVCNAMVPAHVKRRGNDVWGRDMAGEERAWNQNRYCRNENVTMDMWST